MIEFGECLAKFRMVITRLTVLDISAARDSADVHHGNFLTQKFRKGDFFWLKFGIRKLNTEGYSQIAAPRGIEGELPDGVEVEFPRLLLNVAPVTADV